jgi:hypothetical protein
MYFELFIRLQRNRPFCDLLNDLDKQILNGINTGRVLQSNTSCAVIFKHTVDEIEKKTAENMLTR